MIEIENALKIAREYYNEDTFYHAMRVAAYASNSNLIPKNKKYMCVWLLLCYMTY